MPRPTADHGPVRIEVVDLEGPLPELAPSERYRHAWVVGRRGGVPLGLVEIDLTRPAGEVAQQLQALRELPQDPSAAAAVDESALPRVSVVVPSVVARPEDLARCLTSLEQLRYPRFEVLLVDNRRRPPDDDPLPRLVAASPHVRVVRETRPGISAARNAGLAAADGEVVVFTDDDVQVDPGWLAAFGRRFALDPRLEAVTGLILPAELESPAQLYFERYYGGFSGERTFAPLTLTSGHGSVGRARVTVRDAAGRPVREFALYGIGAYGAGANMAFRRDLLLGRGGFDVDLGTGTPARGGEDLAALIDVLWDGGTLGYEPAAVVHHRHRRELPDLEHQLDGNGVGFTAMLTALVRRDPGHLVGLSAQLPLAARRLGAQSLGRLRGRAARPDDTHEDAPQFPQGLVLTELRGMTRGPAAYWRSRRSARHGSGTEPGTGGAALPADPSPARGALARLAEDVRSAGDHLLLTTLGGSVLLPGTVRRLIYAAAGADARSAPGAGFVHGGDPRNLRIGSGVYMNWGVHVESLGQVTIGDGVAIGMGVMIVTSHHEVDEHGRWAPTAVGRPITIGDRVWLGARVLVLPGAVIEPDVVVAAGAVVTGRLESHGLYAGVPARRIRTYEPLPTAGP